MSYRHEHHSPPPGFGPPHPPGHHPGGPPHPPGYPPGGPPPPPQFYPPPPHVHRHHHPPPPVNVYQGYFNPPPPYIHRHEQYYDSGCSSLLTACLGTLCCCCLLNRV